MHSAALRSMLVYQPTIVCRMLIRRVNDTNRGIGTVNMYRSCSGWTGSYVLPI